MAKTKTPSGLSMKHKIGYACGDLDRPRAVCP